MNRVHDAGERTTAPAIASADAAPWIRARSRWALGGTGSVGAWLALAGWGALVALWITGTVETVGHDQEGTGAALASGLFLVGWLIMIAAMMLPSSLPAFRRIDRALAGAGGPRPATVLLGYLVAWSAVGVAAFLADGLLHRSIDHLPWLAQRPAIVPGVVAMFAGGAELWGRTPAPASPSIDPSAGPYAMGKVHAIDRIRRCWPLMLFAIAVGMTRPAWMIALTLAMALELRPRASAVLRGGGLILVVLGATVIVEPTWLPLLVGTG